jgi:hypothetical protein
MGKKGNFKFVVGLLAGLAAGLYVHSAHGKRMKKKIKKQFRDSEGFSSAKSAFKEYLESLTKNQYGQDSPPSEKNNEDTEENIGI